MKYELMPADLHPARVESQASMDASAISCTPSHESSRPPVHRSGS